MLVKHVWVLGVFFSEVFVWVEGLGLIMFLVAVYEGLDVFAPDWDVFYIDLYRF
jgi:hypothetical protein